MLHGAGTVPGRALGLLISALRLFDNFDITNCLLSILPPYVFMLENAREVSDYICLGIQNYTPIGRSKSRRVSDAETL